MAKSNTSIGATSRKQSRKRPTAIDRPFDPELLKRARGIAEKYQVVVRFTDGLYFGRTLELPYATNHGRTREEAFENTIDIATTTVAYMLEQGQIPPAPDSQDKRDEQVNVRLSLFERAFLEEAARNRGYRGVSDFMRAAALASVR